MSLTDYWRGASETGII